MRASNWTTAEGLEQSLLAAKIKSICKIDLGNKAQLIGEAPEGNTPSYYRDPKTGVWTLGPYSLLVPTSLTWQVCLSRTSVSSTRNVCRTP